MGLPRLLRSLEQAVLNRECRGRMKLKFKSYSILRFLHAEDLQLVACPWRRDRVGTNRTRMTSYVAHLRLFVKNVSSTSV